MNMIHKSIIREQGKARRADLGMEVRREFDARIIARCQTELHWNDYERVMLFLPIERHHEIDLWPLVRWIWATWPAVEVYVPKVTGEMMEAVRITPLTKLSKNRFQIPEPVDGEALEPGELLDLILTPLLGFDAAGHRVGYGRGYFDWFFAAQPMAERVGLGYEFLSVAEGISAGNHDIKLQAVITEERLVRI
jgi:5-formyltetrahydrofolate cyclo-ligase